MLPASRFGGLKSLCFAWSYAISCSDNSFASFLLYADRPVFHQQQRFLQVLQVLSTGSVRFIQTCYLEVVKKKRRRMSVHVCTYTEESFRILRRLLRELVRNVTVFICIIQKQLYKPFLRSTFLSSTMARRHSVQRLQSLHGFSSLLLHVKIDPKPDLSPPPAPPHPPPRISSLTNGPICALPP